MMLAQLNYPQCQSIFNWRCCTSIASCVNDYWYSNSSLWTCAMQRLKLDFSCYFNFLSVTGENINKLKPKFKVLIFFSYLNKQQHHQKDIIAKDLMIGLRKIKLQAYKLHFLLHLSLYFCF